MSEISFRRVFGMALILGVALAGAGQEASKAQPPEYREMGVAFRLEDPAARLNELLRIKAAYPKSRYLAILDQNITNTRIQLAGKLDDVLALQKSFLVKAKGPDALQGPFMAAEQLLNHPQLAAFDKAKVLGAVLKYRESALQAAADAATYQSLPEDQKSSFRYFFSTGIELLAAQAFLNAGDASKAMSALKSYRDKSGDPNGQYAYLLGGALEKLNKIPEASEAFLAAAVDNYQDSEARAKALYVRINGKADGFEAKLDAKARLLPFKLGSYTPASDWKGKVVLAELFTGAECPPCVASDLAFDGLLETYPPQVLAVLEYHVPIPRPDPIMNPSSKKRQEYYGVGSSPTVYIDGEKKLVGGGSRSQAGGKYLEYKTEIDSRIGGLPGVTIKAKAALAGATVKVECEFGPAAKGNISAVALVQTEERYRGSNGILFHKMVVRDLVILKESAKRADFDLPGSVTTTDRYLTDFEKNDLRFKGFKFAERKIKIDPKRLKVVVFVQDKTSQKILNALVLDVK